MKIPVVSKKDYILYLENLDGNVFIHCDCFKWNKTIKQSLKKDVDNIVAFIGKPILALHDSDDTKHLKFLNMMGFSFFNKIKVADSSIKELFIRRT